MILLTVGTQLPFDRLVSTVDRIAPKLQEPVFGQIGNGTYLPKNFEFCRLLKPKDMIEMVQASSSMISHAGTGSLLTARRYNKAILIFPRQAQLGEHRNDHQLATCEHFKLRLGVEVAYSEQDLINILVGMQPNRAYAHDANGSRPTIGANILSYIKTNRFPFS